MPITREQLKEFDDPDFQAFIMRNLTLTEYRDRSSVMRTRALYTAFQAGRTVERKALAQAKRNA